MPVQIGTNRECFENVGSMFISILIDEQKDPRGLMDKTLRRVI